MSVYVYVYVYVYVNECVYEYVYVPALGLFIKLQQHKQTTELTAGLAGMAIYFPLVLLILSL